MAKSVSYAVLLCGALILLAGVSDAGDKGGHGNALLAALIGAHAGAGAIFSGYLMGKKSHHGGGHKNTKIVLKKAPEVKKVAVPIHVPVYSHGLHTSHNQHGYGIGYGGGHY